MYPLNGPSGIRGDGESDGVMPQTYTRSVRELELQLSEMRRSEAMYQFEAGHRRLSERLTTLRKHAMGYYMVPKVQKWALVLITERGTRPLLDERGWPRKQRSGERVLLNSDGPAKCPVLCFARKPDARADFAWGACLWIGAMFPFEPEIPPVALAA